MFSGSFFQTCTLMAVFGLLCACSGASLVGANTPVGKFINSASTASSQSGSNGNASDQKPASSSQDGTAISGDADGAQAGGNSAQGVNGGVVSNVAGNGGAGAAIDAVKSAGGAGNPATAANPLSPNRWVAMGDFGLVGLSSQGIPDCTIAADIQRSVCSNLNSRCKSTFATTCPDGTCRRLFKCITGQTNSLIWFPMGDNHTTSSTGLPTCAANANIAGSACSVANDRCLSSFCTSGSGADCGRRLFKCLTSGIPGQLYYRWMGDKPVAELANLPECAATSNIAGTQCFTENSGCISQFFTDAPANTKRRLFKCTP